MKSKRANIMHSQNSIGCNILTHPLCCCYHFGLHPANVVCILGSTEIRKRQNKRHDKNLPDEHNALICLWRECKLEQTQNSPQIHDRESGNDVSSVLIC